MFRKLSYRGLKFCVNTGYLFTFSLILLQIIFSIKIVFQTSISCQKMNQFCDPKRLKAIKKTSSRLIGSFDIKKIQNLFESSFFNKTFLLFWLFKSPRDKSLFMSTFRY